MITDTLNRPIHDLRISVIDRCNFRCPYCMPADEYSKNYQFLNKDAWLQFDEIVRLTKLFVQFGGSKVRLTGGEPLLREDLSVLIKNLNAVNGIKDLALTTNGALLAENIDRLKGIGLTRLTLSLDSLDAETFSKMSGGKAQLDRVLAGLRAAENNGFNSIKINAVIRRGINDDSVIDLVKFFRGTKHVLRFIEYMDVGNCNHWDSKDVVPSKEIFQLIHGRFPLKAVSPNYLGEVAERYVYEDGTGEIGFISSVTQPFCGTCTRARLSTDGKFYTCLFATEGTDLRGPLREGVTDEELLGLIKTIWTKRNDRYSELRGRVSNASRLRRVEMFQIGG